MFHGVLLAIFTLALSTRAFASLYPTQPIQDTVYYIGEVAPTTWMDDGTFPLLGDMGPITIELYADPDTYLATLATNVSPLVQSLHLDIPRRAVYDGSNFILRYTTNTPYNMTVYSADFTVVVRGDSIPDSSSPTLGSFPSSTTGLVSSPAASAALPLSPAATSQPPSSPPPKPTNAAIPPFSPSNIGGMNQPSSRRSTNGAGGRIDTEKLKFRLVFILWPALLGVTLAL